LSHFLFKRSSLFFLNQESTYIDEDKNIRVVELVVIAKCGMSESLHHRNMIRVNGGDTRMSIGYSRSK